MQQTRKNNLGCFQTMCWSCLFGAWGLACEPISEWTASENVKDPAPGIRSESKRLSKGKAKPDLGLKPDSEVGEGDKSSSSVPATGKLQSQVAQSLGLRFSADGEWIYDDPTKPWKASIEPDGRVRFSNARAKGPVNDALRFSGPEDWMRRGQPGSKSAKKIA